MIPRCRKTRWLERVGHGPACAHGDTACFRILTESGIMLWRHRLLNTIASKCSVRVAYVTSVLRRGAGGCRHASGHISRGRIALPLRHGGQGLIDPSHIADQALVANWAACAPFLANTAPALSDIANENSGPRRNARNAAAHHQREHGQSGPCHGHMRPS